MAGEQYNTVHVAEKMKLMPSAISVTRRSAHRLRLVNSNVFGALGPPCVNSEDMLVVKVVARRERRLPHCPLSDRLCQVSERCKLDHLRENRDES